MSVHWVAIAEGFKQGSVKTKFAFKKRALANGRVRKGLDWAL